MEEISTTVLTKTDHLILQSYREFCDGLSSYIGEGFEIVLHSLENFEHSAIKVINGYHTARSEGAPITDLALSMLSKIRKNPFDTTYYSYFSKNRKGEPLKSATIPIFGEGHRIIGLLCVNFYLNTSFFDIIKNYIPPTEESTEDSVHKSESYVDNSEDLIDQAVTEVRLSVLGDNTISSNNKNKVIIAQLYERGIFNLKNSVIRCANILSISKNTVYMHIRNLSNNGQ